MHRPKFWKRLYQMFGVLFGWSWMDFRSEMIGFLGPRKTLAKPFSMADIFGKEQQSSQQLKQHTAKGW